MKTETNNLRLQYAQPESYVIKVRARNVICISFDSLDHTEIMGIDEDEDL